MQRHARRIIEKRDLQDAAGLLRQGRVAGDEREQQRARSREAAKVSLHEFALPCSRELDLTAIPAAASCSRRTIARPAVGAALGRLARGSATRQGRYSSAGLFV